MSNDGRNAEDLVREPMSLAAQEALIRESWKILEDVLYRGELRLREGEELRKLGAHDIIMVAQKLADKRPPELPKVDNFDNLNLERTDGQEEAKGVVGVKQG